MGFLLSCLFMVFPAAGSLELLRKSMMGFGASDVCGL